MVSIKFDGTDVSNPIEWAEMFIAVEYDAVNQITEISYDDNLTFIEDAFTFLYSRRNDECVLIPVEVTSYYGDTYITLKANIFITDCVFDELNCTVKVPLQDDGYSSRIQNNKRTKVGLATPTTKNGLALTLPTERLVTFFTPSTGGYSNSIRGYTVFEAFKFLVSWMSDNTVTFVSDYFETGEGNNDWLCSGVDIRLSTVPPANEVSPPQMSFDSLYTLMRRVRNVAIGFQRDASNNPVLRLEPLSFFRNASTGLTLTDVNRTELSYIKELLYARVLIGSDITLPSKCDNGNTNCAAANNISYYGFNQEEYYITGECNEDVDFDLTIQTDFVVDTNTIEDVLIYGSESYDEKVFLVHVFENTPSAWRATSTDVFNIGDYWYNEAYTNKEILARYIAYLTGTLNLFNLYNGINLFLYEGNVPSGVLLPFQTPTYTRYPTTAGDGVPMNNLVYDPFNTIDTGNEGFYPPNDGVYQFCVGIAIDDFPSSAGGVIVAVHLQIETYTAANVLIQTYQSDVRTHVTTLVAPVFETWVSDFIPMNAGDYAVFSCVYAQSTNPAISQAEIVLGGSSPQDQYFQCCASRVAVQDAQVNTGQSRRVARTSCDYPIPLSEFYAYFEDTTSLIRLLNQRIDRTGWVDSIKFNINSGASSVSILSTDN
jgi:hypothetical protein